MLLIYILFAVIFLLLVIIGILIKYNISLYSSYYSIKEECKEIINYNLSITSAEITNKNKRQYYIKKNKELLDKIENL